MANWTDSTKFTAETIRNILLTAAGAFAALLILTPLQQRADYDAEVEKTRLSIKAKVVDDFRVAADHYTQVAYDACRAYSTDPKEPRNAATINAFEGEVVDNYRTALHRVHSYFQDNALDQQIDHILSLHNDLFNSCKTMKDESLWKQQREHLKASDEQLMDDALRNMGFKRK